MAFRFEFDPANRFLLARLEGRVTEGSVAECHWAARKYSTATRARASIVDFSSATEFALSHGFLQALAKEPALNGLMRPCFIVAPTDYGFGLARKFQIEGENLRPSLDVIHTIDEAAGGSRHSITTLRAFGVRSLITEVARNVE